MDLKLDATSRTPAVILYSAAAHLGIGAHKQHCAVVRYVCVTPGQEPQQCLRMIPKNHWRHFSTNGGSMSGRLPVELSNTFHPEIEGLRHKYCGHALAEIIFACSIGIDALCVAKACYASSRRPTAAIGLVVGDNGRLHSAWSVGPYDGESESFGARSVSA